MPSGSKVHVSNVSGDGPASRRISAMHATYMIVYKSEDKPSMIKKASQEFASPIAGGKK